MSDAIRLMTEEDIPFADSLRAIAGWNQTIEDWKRFLACAPGGCFIAESDEAPAGTATTINYENKIAWIGMVLVHPNFRRRGIGRGLLNHCIEHLRARDVRSIKLDATPLGQKLYETLGFEEEFTLTRWRGFISEGRLKMIHVPNSAKIVALDANAFGAVRLDLILRLQKQSQTVFIEDEAFGMRRPGATANYLGPVVATTAISGRQILDCLALKGEVIVDIPDGNHAAVQWAQSKGFVPERQLTRMFLGEKIRACSPQNLYAIAAPEVG